VAILGTRQGGEHLDAVPRPGRRLHVSFGEAVTISRDPRETGRASMDRAAKEIRAALAKHVQDAVRLSGQALPSADFTQERSDAVAGSPADHH
jgi:1-acyl-sn-glycerol-3-phosphate acyltransferase